jgi:hypothetical protein
MRKLKYLLIALLVVNFCYTLSGVLFAPIKSMDAIGIWLLKAKAFYLEEGFPKELLLSPNFSYSHQQYPILLPFLFSLVYKLSAGINEKAVLLFYPFIYAAVLALAYKTFRTQADCLKALVFTYIYSMFGPLLAQGGREHAGNADIILTLINWGIVYLALAKNKTKYAPYLIGFLIMLASQIKMEGIFIAPLILFLPLTKLKKSVLFLISTIPFVVWRSVVFKLNLPMDFGPYIPSFFEFSQRSIIIITETVKEMFNIRNWYIFWPIFFVSLLLKEKLSPTVKQTLIPTLLIAALGYFCVYMFFDMETSSWVASSVDRIMLQLSPFIYLIFFAKSHSISLTFKK